MNKHIMKINETELKYIIQEAVRKEIMKQYGNLDEGKFGKALGTLALGGALMFGNGNQVNAQNNINRDIPIQTQEQGFKFNSSQFKSDYEKFSSIVNSNGAVEGAKELLAAFPLDNNGAIHFEYIITYGEGYDIKHVMETSYDWFNYSFSSAEAAVNRYDIENGIITARGSYLDLGQFNLNAVYYAKLVRVTADTDIILRFRENKIKIDVLIRNYRMISAESTMRSNNSLVAVSDVFPSNNNGDNKIAYARSFVNSCSNSMDKIKKYIEFLNDNMMTNDVYNDDAAWEIGNSKKTTAAKDMWNFKTPENLKERYFEILKLLKQNRKQMRSMEKNSEEHLNLKQQTDELYKELRTLEKDYLAKTGRQISQFEDNIYNR